MKQNAAESMSVKRAPIASQIAARLRLDIFTGKYKPGERLAPEREIAEKYGISRVSVRQALQELAREGWIEIVQGRGATALDFRQTVGLEVLPSLLADSPQAVVTPETFLTMHDFTNWLYRQICLSAEPKAGPDDKKALLKIISAYEKKISVERYVEIEGGFYSALLDISQNLVLRMFFNTYMKTISRLVDAGTLALPPLPGDLYISFNQDLIEAVCGHKAALINAIFDQYRPAIQAALNMYLNTLGIDIAESEKQKPANGR